MLGHDISPIKNRNISERLKSLFNNYSGQRCFIMGNGPSVNFMNLELLKDEVVWGFNKCYLLFERLSWLPRFNVTNDYRLTQDIAITINTLIQKSTILIFFFPYVITPYYPPSYFFNRDWQISMISCGV